MTICTRAGSTCSALLDLLSHRLIPVRGRPFEDQASQKADPLALDGGNAATIAAMKEAQAGNLPQFGDVQGLLDDLHSDD